MSLSRAAPSSMEYSVCTWRCTKPAPLLPAPAIENRLLQACAETPLRALNRAGGSGQRSPEGPALARQDEPNRARRQRAAAPPAGAGIVSTVGPEHLEGVRQVRRVGAGELGPVTVRGV